MQWQIRTSSKFLKQLSKLDKQVADRILSYLDSLEEINDPKSRGRALSNDKKGLWRYRVGDYRIICEIADTELVVLALEVGHRSSVYE